MVTGGAGLESVAAAAGEPRRVTPASAAVKVMALDLSAVLGAAKPLMVSGRGSNWAAARRRCLGEAAERLALAWRPGIACVREKASNLGQLALVPRGFDPEERWDWLPVEPLNGGSARFAPASLVHLGHPEARKVPERLKPDSSGAAAGSTPASAMRAGLLELIERDAVAAWWHGRKRVPGFGTASLADGRMNRFALELLATGRLLWFLVLESERALPVAAAVSASGDGRSIVIGTAAGRDRRDAAMRAVGELAQNLLGADALPSRRPGPGRERAAFDWLTGARLSDEPHLIPVSEASPEEGTAPGQSALLRHLREMGVFVYVHAFPVQRGVPVMRLLSPALATPRNAAENEEANTYPF